MSSAEDLDRLQDEQRSKSRLLERKEGTMTPHRELWALRAELDELEARTLRREMLNGIEPDEKIRGRISRLKYLIRGLEKGGA
jgi:hypothetical protein